MQSSPEQKHNTNQVQNKIKSQQNIFEDISLNDTKCIQLKRVLTIVIFYRSNETNQTGCDLKKTTKISNHQNKSGLLVWMSGAFVCVSSISRWPNRLHPRTRQKQEIFNNNNNTVTQPTKHNILTHCPLSSSIYINTLLWYVYRHLTDHWIWMKAKKHQHTPDQCIKAIR